MSGQSYEERLKAADRKFYAETGKTPDQEAQDSAKMAGIVLLLVFGAIVVGAGYGLWAIWGLIGN